MTRVTRTIELPYRAEDVFDLISDVRRYPEFVKWLRSLRVLKEDRSDGGWNGEAEAAVGFKGFSETFTTSVKAERPAPSSEARDWSVKVELVRGPFRRLHNAWRINETELGSRLEFEIDFEFRNMLLQTLAAANLEFAVGRLVEAFIAEARRRYPPVRRA